jgi:hypothetical protein
LKATLKQVDDLYVFIKSLEDPKEVIVEDMESARIRATLHGELSMETSSFPRYADWPKGIPDIMNAHPMEFMMFNTFVGIPIYNAEMRIFGKKGFPGEKVLANIFSYNDGPILNEFYKSVRTRFNQLTKEEREIILEGRAASGISFEIELLLLDMRILHRIYINKSLKNIVVVAGGWHIENIYKILIKLGYVAKYKQGLSTEEDIKLYKAMKPKAEKIKKGFSLFKNKEKEIGKLYSDYINTITLDISKLSLPKSQAAPAPQPASMRRSKL